MIKPSDLIGKFRQALDEGWGYIPGTAGELWTQGKQNAAADENTRKYGARWIGKRVADCSGLFSWAFRQLGGRMYHGSNTMWRQYTTATGALKNGKRTDGKELRPGTAVFRVKGTDYYHVGLYVGGAAVIEAKGIRYGVVASDVSAWHTWGELKGVQYGEGEAVPEEKDFAGACTVFAENGRSVNVRDAPNGAKTDSLPVGTVVDVTGDNGSGWCRVKYESTGWMMKKYLREGRG